MKKTMKSLHCWDSITLDIVAALLEKITEQDAKTNSIQNPVKNPCAIGCFLNNSGAKHMRTSYQLNDSAQLYFTAGIYILHGKITAV